MRKSPFPLSWIGLAAVLASCGEGYSSEAIQYRDAAQAALVAECVRNVQTCTSSQRLFWEAGGGVYINLYETQDAMVVGAVVAKLVEMRAKIEVPKVVLTVFSSKHGQPQEKFREVVIK